MMKKYEYKVIRVQDDEYGMPPRELIEKALSDYSAEGWRFVGITTNELGRNSNTQGSMGNKQILNATIDCTVIIMERPIAAD